MLERTHISSRALGLAHAGLLSVCESAKITLSTAEQAEIGFQQLSELKGRMSQGGAMTASYQR